MKKYIPLSLIIIFCSVLTSCELIGGIFKAGMWTGIIIVVLIIALAIWLISKIFGRRD